MDIQADITSPTGHFRLYFTRSGVRCIEDFPSPQRFYWATGFTFLKVKPIANPLPYHATIYNRGKDWYWEIFDYGLGRVISEGGPFDTSAEAIIHCRDNNPS